MESGDGGVNMREGSREEENRMVECEGHGSARKMESA